MIDRKELEYDFTGCNPTEVEILSKYWNCNSNLDFELTLRMICNSYNISIGNLYGLSNRKALYWNFGTCDCGNPIKAKLNKRSDLISCLRGKGRIETYKNIEYFKLCRDCNRKEDEREMFEQNFGKIDPFEMEINDIDRFFEINLALTKESVNDKVKFVTNLIPENDLILKADVEYRFVAFLTDDKKLVLSINEANLFE